MPVIQVVLSAACQDRFGARVAGWVVDRLASRGDLTVERVDLNDHPLPFTDRLPPAYTLRDYPADAIARLGRIVDRADGYVMLAAEYNHGYPALLKNAMDHTFLEWRRKPVAFVGWGHVGGVRAVEQLRLAAVECEMAPLRHSVHILPDVLLAARDSGALQPFRPFRLLEPKLKLLGDDLAWWTRALAAARAAPQPPPDPPT